MTTKTSVEIVYSSKRRRTASLKYTAQGRFILSVPEGSGKAWVDEFLEGRRSWMEKTRKRADAHQSARRIGPGSRIETSFYVLEIQVDAKLRYPQYRVDRRRAERKSVFYLAPEFFLPQNSDKLYVHLEKYLLAQIMKPGSEVLLARARYWADLHGISVQEFFVKVQKSRLGYCTHDNRIMLNARLLFSPQRLVDYVICHELAHTKHKNHSKQYWTYLEKLFPGARTADRQLRDPASYSMRVAAP